MITYPERVNLVIERYSSLVKYVERLAFPKHKHEPPAEANKWGKVRRALYKLSQPLTIGQNTGVLASKRKGIKVNLNNITYALLFDFKRAMLALPVNTPQTLHCANVLPGKWRSFQGLISKGL